MSLILNQLKVSNGITLSGGDGAQLNGNGSTLSITTSGNWNSGVSSLIQLTASHLNFWSNGGSYFFKNSAGNNITTIDSTTGGVSANGTISTSTDIKSPIYYGSSGTTYFLDIDQPLTATTSMNLAGAIQTSGKIGTMDNSGFFLRGISDATHKIWYESSSGHNIWEANSVIKFNYYNGGSPATKVYLDTANGNMAIGASAPTAGVKLDVTGNIGIQSENSLRLYSSTNYSRIYASSTLGLVINGRFNGSFYNMAITAGSSSIGVLYALTDGRVNIDPDGYGTVCSGTISDTYGNLRVLPENAKTAAYTLATTDTGRLITITTGGITVPANGTAAITAGMVFTIINKSGAAQTITQASGVTLRLSGTTTTGDRTLAGYGVATIVCIGTSDFVISGSGLT